MSLPASRHGKVGLGNLLRHQPQGENISTVRAQAQAAELRGNDCAQEPRAEEVLEIFLRERGVQVIFGSSRGKMKLRKVTKLSNNLQLRRGQLNRHSPRRFIVQPMHLLFPS